VADLQHTYSYTATFEDGTTIFRDMNDPESDKCQTRTDGTGSRFTDVQEKEKESKLISFVVHNDEHSYGVDLRDGHFEVNGVIFFQHRPDLQPYKDFRIIHYRSVRRKYNLQQEEIGADVMCYAVGWQVTHNGENVKRELIF
jgi:hypothetical protein